MNLYIRLLITWIKSRFQKKIDTLDANWQTMCVWPFDHDLFGHMTNSKYFGLVDVALMGYLLRTGYLAKIIKNGWIPYVIHKEIQFFSPLHFPQSFKTELQLIGWTDKHILFEARFHQKNRIAAECKIFTRAVNQKGERMFIPDIMRICNITEKSPEIPIPVLDKIRILESRRDDLKGKQNANPHS